MGPNPTLPPPRTSLIPVVKVAKAVGWSGGAKPIAADGMNVVAFATGLSHPRSLYVLPNGDVLIHDGATVLKAGSLLVQRDTSRNTSDSTTMIAAIIPIGRR